MKRIKTEYIDKHIKPDGTEQITREYKEIIWGEEPNYVKLYLQDMLYLNGLSSQYYKLLNCLIKEISYASEEEGLCIALIPYTKKRILNEMGWKNMISLNNALHKLKQYKIIYSIDRGLYRLNPYLFGKGNWQDIAKIRMTINYNDINGRTIKTEIIQQKEQKEQNNENTN